MTGEDLYERLLKRLNEDSATPVFYSISEALWALNAAQRMFVLLTLCLEATGTLDLDAGTAHYRLLSTFSDFLLPLRVRVAGSGGLRVRPSRLAELDALSPTWQAAAGTPERYACVGFDHFSIYKQPVGGTSLDVTYARCPGAIARSSTPEIRGEYHPALIDGAIPLLRLQEGGQEFRKSLRYFERFLKAAAKMGNYVRARNLAERYDRVPPDIERMDLSRLVKLATKRPKPAMLDVPQAQEQQA